VYGELIDTIFQGQKYNIQCETREWRLARALVEFLETAWKEPDEGIWEVRGPRRHFTHSKVMAWVAFDRMVKMVERFGLGGPADRWRRQREEIRREVCAQGVDPRRNCFVQYYGGTALDASLLMIPLVGFLPADDPRMLATVRAIERELTRDEFVQRYPTDPQVDGLPPGEGAFLACTFWLVDNLALLGERDKAIRKFEWLLALRNDVGLLSEEYDPQTKRLVGNFPQAFSHVALVESALNLQASEPLSRRLNA
jgi:GH15 family glucan-1,4-alpha-glucosidase